MHALLLAALTLAGTPTPAPVAAPAAARAGADGGLLLVLHKRDATLSLYDPETGERLHTSPTGAGPHEAAVSPDGRTAVVCDYGPQGSPGSTLTVFDCVAREVVRTVDLGEYRRPHGIEFAPDGKSVLVTCEVNRAVVRVDPFAGEVLASYPTEQNASHMLAQAPDGARAYVANIASGSISVVDLASGELRKVLPTGAGCEAIDVTPDGRRVWVGNRAGDTLSVVDTETLEVAAEVPCAQFPIRLKITRDGRHVLVSNAASGDVAVFDAATHEELARIPMALEAQSDQEGRLFGDQFGQSPVPVGLLLHPDGKRAFVANTNADIVTVLDLATWSVADRIPTGAEPDGMAWVPAPPPAEDR